MCENTCSQRYVEPKTDKRASAMFLRLLNFSGADVQHVRMQAPYRCAGVVSDCFWSSANFVTHTDELFSSISCISMSRMSIQSIRAASKSCPSKLSGLIKKENIGPYLLKSPKRVVNSTSSSRMYAAISAVLMLRCVDSSLKCRK